MNLNYKVNIALAQLDVDVEYNFLATKKALINAKEKGADIVLFPEMWTTGYEEFPNEKNKIKAWKEKSIWIGNAKYNEYVNLAKEIGIAMVFTFLYHFQQTT